jgi:NAD(P)-dependent dehydrogenase (short-subunit alcohol dehydrogenase family)
VITITSTAGLVGQEFVAAYAASKFALEGWMESLRFDLAPFGISTMAVEPGSRGALPPVGVAQLGAPTAPSRMR